MGYIPKDAKWYLAEIIEEITIEDELEIIVISTLYLYVRILLNKPTKKR